MAIHQEERTNKEMGLTFEDLAHIPFISKPNCIEEITEEWFRLQRITIENKIAAYNDSITSDSARSYELKKLQNILNRLQKFTENVLSSRKKQESIQPHVIPAKANANPIYQEYNKRQYDNFVDSLIAKRKRDEEIAKQTEYLKLYRQPESSNL